LITAVLALPREEIPVAEARVVVRQRELNDDLRFGGATTGPRPTSWTSQTGRDAEELSCTYAFQFGSRELWKIGHAKDVAARLADVNKHVPVEVLGDYTAFFFADPARDSPSREMLREASNLLAWLFTTSC
jgi:hypothetical protein